MINCSNIAPSLKTRRNTIAFTSSVPSVNHASNYVAAERTQLYDRISMTMDVELSSKIFSLFDIPITEKKKKVFLVNEICKFVIRFECFLPY